MAVRLGLAGDTMLGRAVAQRLARVGPQGLFSAAVREVLAGADLVLLNLECCVSDRGAPWDAPRKPFHFRAPPPAVQVLTWLGVHCVTLANNHALDFGYPALADTVRRLDDAGIEHVGAGADLAQARAGAVLRAGRARIGVLGVCDHPADFAAAEDRPGTAYADLGHGVPDWLLDRVADLAGRCDAVLVTPHWGPNLTTEPLPHLRAAGRALVEAGATLVAGHSAHVFHGVSERVLHDLGDFIDDYMVHPMLRNDLGLLFLVTVDDRRPVRLEAVPLKLTCGYTGLAQRHEADWIGARFITACAELGTRAVRDGDRLVVSWD